MSPNNRLWTKEKSKQSRLAGSKNKKSKMPSLARSKDQRKASSQIWLEARIKKQAVKFGWKQ